jgi:hypothetical protein
MFLLKSGQSGQEYLSRNNVGGGKSFFADFFPIRDDPPNKYSVGCLFDQTGKTLSNSFWLQF